MKKYRFSRILIVTALLILSHSCEESQVAYIEVRNKSVYLIEDVSWGKTINLGTIPPNEESGKETELYGKEFIYLKVREKKFRSKDKIAVDAQTSATFIVKDTSDFVRDGV